MHKSRSPSRYDSGQVEHKIERHADIKQSSNPFINNKGKIIELAELLAKRARSNSPKKVLAKNIKLSSKCRSPLARKNSPLDLSRNKNTNASQRTTLKGGQSPVKIQNKISPQRSCKKLGIEGIDNKELNALKYLAKQKHKLNKELWEAAENGNLSKIKQLLDLYKRK
jgi:hypothetical protein